MRRVLQWDACWNIRDLGGYPTRSGRVTKYERVIRAGNLSKLTEQGRAAVRSAGVRTVIDLRDPREFAIEIDPFHETGPWHGDVRYVNVPLISEANWKAHADKEQSKRGYELIVELSAQNIANAMTAIADAEPGPVVIHCHAGKERTGVIAALLLELVGVPDESIVEDYVASDEHLGALYEEWSLREPDPTERTTLLRTFRCTPGDITAPLEYVRRRGGVAKYLTDAGSSAATLKALATRLLT